MVCETSKASDQPAHMCSLTRAFACHMNILSVKLLTEHNLEFLSLTGAAQAPRVYTCRNAALLEITWRGSYGILLKLTINIYAHMLIMLSPPKPHKCGNARAHLYLVQSPGGLGIGHKILKVLEFAMVCLLLHISCFVLKHNTLFIVYLWGDAFLRSIFILSTASERNLE